MIMTERKTPNCLVVESGGGMCVSVLFGVGVCLVISHATLNTPQHTLPPK